MILDFLPITDMPIFTNHLHTDTDTDIYFFPTPNSRDHQVSSVVEFIHSIIMHSLTMLALQQMQA